MHLFPESSPRNNSEREWSELTPYEKALEILKKFEPKYPQWQKRPLIAKCAVANKILKQSHLDAYYEIKVTSIADASKGGTMYNLALVPKDLYRQ